MKTKAALFILVSSFLINSSFSQSLGIQVGITGEFYSVYSGVRYFSPGGQAFGMNSFLIKVQGEQSNVISVYPNPASSELYISENLPLQPTDIYLMDVLGRRELTLAPDARRIDVTNTPAGIKTLVIVTNGAVYTNRISIVR